MGIWVVGMGWGGGVGVVLGRGKRGRGIGGVWAVLVGGVRRRGWGVRLVEVAVGMRVGVGVGGRRGGVVLGLWGDGGEGRVERGGAQLGFQFGDLCSVIFTFLFFVLVF